MFRGISNLIHTTALYHKCILLQILQIQQQMIEINIFGALWSLCSRYILHRTLHGSYMIHSVVKSVWFSCIPNNTNLFKFCSFKYCIRGKFYQQQYKNQFLKNHPFLTDFKLFLLCLLWKFGFSEKATKFCVYSHEYQQPQNGSKGREDG